jgi:diguanylate cyclase (GGDEF)-like protein/PAS domain S-box-containing protein
MASSLPLLGGASAATLAVAAYFWRFRLRAKPATRSDSTASAVLASAPVAAPPHDDWIAVAAGAAIDALWDWDPVNDTLRLSTRWREIIGMPPEPMRRSSDEWWSRVHPSDRNQLHVDVTTQLSGSNERFSIEHRVRHEDGRWLHLQWIGAIRRDETGRAVRVAGSVRDMTAQRSAEERQRREALYDALTGLPNRSLAIDLLRRAINRTRRQGERRFAVLLVDLDRFNLLNDSLGHGAGDELLKGVARRLGTAIRPGDVAARLGGDEFLLLLDEIPDIAAAESVADRVKLVLAEPIKAITHDVVVSASIGIVLRDPAVDQPTDYLRDAELAMHDAKRKGRARSERFRAGMRDGVRHRVSIEQDLRGAVDREEFMVLYQPVWCTRTATERLLGFEALVRWNHPTKGMLGAGDFVPIAEETDLIVSLGSWALHRACRELVDFMPNGAGAPWVSVNLAARQLADRGLVGLVDTVLHATGLDAARLRLEVTENVILHDEAGARLALETLRARGVRSLMDDFGTGHASLSYLHRLPIGTIKIDRYFVGRMDVSPECLEIVRSIITLARSLGMDVVAEGVEQDAQLAQLRELGCHAVQGFLLARPLHAEEAIALLAALEHTGGVNPRSVTRDLGLAGGGFQSVEAAARELAQSARGVEAA